MNVLLVHRELPFSALSFPSRKSESGLPKVDWTPAFAEVTGR